MTKPPPVITLLNDFGLLDGYTGAMKGVILQISPLAQIVDLCVNVNPQDVFGGAYILYTAHKYFPKGSVHVAVVDPGVGSNRKILCLKTKDYIFLAPDNGILSFIVDDEEPEFIIEVTNDKYFLPNVSNTFHGRDIFAPVAAHILNGVNPEELGNKISKIESLNLPRPVLSPEGVLTGEIIYIDSFGNTVTNIHHKSVERVRSSANNNVALTSGDISIEIAGKKILRISESYAESNSGELLAIFGSSGYLEIAANRENAKNILNVNKGDKVVIKNN